MALSLGLIVNVLLAITALSSIGYVLIFIKPTKKVMLLRPRDHRGKSLSIRQETDIGLACKAIKGVTHRFIKIGPSWVFHEGGRMITRFFGIEGTAYTALARGDAIVNVSVKEYLEFLWGEKFYKAIPEAQQTKVETDVIGITIKISEIDEDEKGLPTLTSSDINDEDDNLILSKIAKPQKQKTSQAIMNTIINFALGAALMYFIVKQGYI